MKRKDGWNFKSSNASGKRFFFYFAQIIYYVSHSSALLINNILNFDVIEKKSSKFNLKVENIILYRLYYYYGYIIITYDLPGFY